MSSITVEALRPGYGSVIKQHFIPAAAATSKTTGVVESSGDP